MYNTGQQTTRSIAHHVRDITKYTYITAQIINLQFFTEKKHTVDIDSHSIH